MEREILFRGKRVDDWEWAEGSLVHRTLFYGEPSECYFIITGGEFHCDYYEAYKVDPATIGQYTGLTDKNGVKIFEGDVVRVCLNPEICVGVVELDERVGAFIVRLPENKCSPFLDLYVARNKAPGLIWTEVIGNIHDNPELLEEKS